LRYANALLDQVSALIQPRELPALLGLLEPVTECLRTNAVPTLKKSVDDGALSTHQPVYRDLLSSLVGLASASQNFDGNGPAVRYHAGFGDETVSLGRNNPEPAVGLTSQPILGSRPQYTGVKPPFRPGVPCGQNDPPNLKAATGPAPAQSKLGARP
jgi:phospholipid/cholesterol/gamma-HCH transport system substrate-binding protein